MTDCAFCQRENVILENRLAYSKWDKFPVAEGHSLIIPKRHVVSYFDLTNEEIVSIYDLAKRTRENIDKEYAPDGYSIFINEGEAAGRTIHHLHIHLLPRIKGDVKNPCGGGRNILPVRKYSH